MSQENAPDPADQQPDRSASTPGPGEGMYLPPPPGFSPTPYPATSPTRNDPLAVASLVLGLVALLSTLFCGLITAITGIVAVALGLTSRSRAKATGGRTGMATAGAILGGVSLILLAVVTAIIVATS